jgi:hypothetical protein
MAVSGTTSFTVTRDDIIQAAMRKLSVLEEGATPTAASVTSYAFMLNVILKSLQKDGIKLWTVNEIALPLQASKTSYSIGPASTLSDFTSDKPLRVVQAFLRNTGVTPVIDIPMQILSKQEYNILGSKFSTGLINSIYYAPLVSTGNLSVFLTPDSATATNYVLYLTVQRQIMDVNLSTDNFDLPAEWYLPLIWMLTAEMSSDAEKPLQDRAYFDSKALFYKTAIEDFDVEEATVKFIPDLRMNMGGFK